MQFKNSILNHKFAIMTMLLLALIGFTAPTHAQTNASNIESLDVRKLTPEQKAQMMAQVVEMQKQANSTSNISSTVREEASKWVELGGNMGQAAVAAARAVGVAANDFVETPLGKITMAVVVYKIIGNELMHVLVGFVFFTSTLVISAHLFRKKIYVHVEYEHVPMFWGMYQKEVIKTCQENISARESNTGWAILILAAGTVITAISVFTA